MASVLSTGGYFLIFAIGFAVLILLGVCNLVHTKESSVAYGPVTPVSRGDREFLEWVEEYNLSEEDLTIIRKRTAIRMIVYYIFSCATAGVLFPLFIRTWLLRKTVKQHCVYPRRGFLFNLCFLTMYISFVTILPLILWLIIRKNGWGAGFHSLYRKGLIGDGENCQVRISRLKRIRWQSFFIALIVAAVVILVLMLLILIVDGKVGELFESDVLCGFTITGLILGAVVGFVAAEVRYRKWRNRFDTENESCGEADEATVERPTELLPNSEELQKGDAQKPKTYTVLQSKTREKKKSSVLALLIVINVLLVIVLVLISVQFRAAEPVGNDAINAVSENNWKLAETGIYIVAAEKGAVIRKSANAHSRRVAKLEKGTEINVTSTYQGWLYIVDNNRNFSGWGKATDFDYLIPDFTLEEAIKLAEWDLVARVCLYDALESYNMLDSGRVDPIYLLESEVPIYACAAKDIDIVSDLKRYLSDHCTQDYMEDYYMDVEYIGEDGAEYCYGGWYKDYDGMVFFVPNLGKDYDSLVDENASLEKVNDEKYVLRAVSFTGRSYIYSFSFEAGKFKIDSMPTCK